jgi:hypothetical protein
MQNEKCKMQNAKRKLQIAEGEMAGPDRVSAF